MNARELHSDALIIDGLVFHGDGATAPLKAGNVAAANITVSHFEADFTRACDEVAQWLAIVAAPDSGWRIVRKASDIEAARAAGEVGLIMGWQNMRPIEDKLDRLRLFHALGLRIMQLTYNHRNLIGDGCLERDNDGGLSKLGREAVAEMNRLGIAIDVSHVGERATIAAAELSAVPILITHANTAEVLDVPRNKSDSAIRAVAETGGTIGLSIHGMMCWTGDPDVPPSLDDFLRHLDHVVDLVGPEHVALGTDLPAAGDLDKLAAITAFSLARYPGVFGAYVQAFGNDIRARYTRDCGSHAELVAITEALLGRGWESDQVRGLLGGNLRRALGRIWPDS